MKIAFLSWRNLAHPQAGGAEVVIDRLADGLSRKGHDVISLSGGSRTQATYESGYLSGSLGGTYSQYLLAPIQFHRYAHDVDVVVDAEAGIPYFSPMWQRKPVVGLVYHIHTDQWAMRYPFPLASLGRWTESWLMPRVYRNSHFVAISKSTAQSLASTGIDSRSITTIEMGSTPIEIVEPKSATPRFLVLSRLVPHKNIEKAIAMWGQVRNRTGGELIIVGSGPEEKALKAQAGEGVHFCGWVDELEKSRQLGAAWLLIHPAHHEGWGMVIMEAAAAGMPTVAYDVKGVRDSVVDGTTGLLAQDDESFIAAWIELAENKSYRETMGKNAADRARTFTWERSIEAFESVLLKSVNRSRSSD